MPFSAVLDQPEAPLWARFFRALTGAGKTPITSGMEPTHQIPRREFLRRSGGLALGAGALLSMPNVLLNRVRAATGESANELIRVGIIAVGGRGRGHLFFPTMAPHVVAVADVDEGHLDRARKDFESRYQRKLKGYTDYRRLIEDKDVDAVLIATPDHWHALPSIHAMQAGKDVYCEKPLTLVIDEGKAMRKAARYYKRIFQTGSQQRSSREFFRACTYVRSGRIGDIKTIRVGIPGVNWTKQPLVPDSAPPPELDYNLWLGPAPWRPYNKWHVHYYFRFFWDYSGGQMTNWGAHHLDIAQWGMGTDDTGPIKVSARAEFDPQGRYEVPSWFEINYEYASGIKVIAGMSHRIGVTFEGQDGIIYVNRGRLESTVPDVLKEPIGEDDVHLYRSTNHHQNWFDCIKSRKLPICDVAIGHRSATVCHLGNLAVRTGRTLHWDPAREEIIGDPAAARMQRYTYRAPWKFPTA
jgi:predicted dehydrogenase